MPLRGLKNRRLRMSGLIISVTMLIGFGFNSCSDVKFTEKASTGGTLECVFDDDCAPKVPVTYTDTFVIPTASSKADILLVIDNSGSMKADVKKLGEKIDGLVAILDAGQIDWQMCYVYTDVSGDNLVAIREWKRTTNNGNITGTGLRVLKSSTAERQNIFLTTMSDIGSSGSGNEQGFTAAREALQNNLNRDCFRSDAVLSTVLISDEDQKSCGGRCQNGPEIPTMTSRDDDDYSNQFKPVDDSDKPENLISAVADLFPEKPFTFHSIVIRPGDNACWHLQDEGSPAFFGKLYADATRLTGGISGDICAASYSQQLADMGTRVYDSINSVTLRCVPTSAPTVVINPDTNPPTTWTQTGNKILFSQPVTSGTTVTVTYTCLQ